MPHLSITNRFLEKIPISILYFGIADIVEAVHDDVMFLIVPTVYASFLLDFFLDKYYQKNEHIKKSEAIITNYLYDNILFYLISFPIHSLLSVDGASWLFIGNLGDLLSSQNTNVMIHFMLGAAFLLAVVCLLLFATLPMFFAYMYFFGYIIVIRVCNL